MVGPIIGLLVFASLGLVRANELSLTVCQDALFRPGASDSMVRPVAVLAGLGLRLGTSGTLDLRAGYSGYANLVRDITWAERRRTLYGVRLQAAPVFRVTTPIKGASVSGGAGLAVSVAKLVQWLKFDSRIYHYWRDVRTLGVDQTFLVGLGYEPSRRLGVDLTLERVGFSLAYGVEWAYRDYVPGKDTVEVADYQKTLDVGWRAAAPIGIGVGLRLKL